MLQHDLYLHQVFSFDSANSKCYNMREQSIKCGSKEKSVQFA